MTVIFQSVYRDIPTLKVVGRKKNTPTVLNIRKHYLLGHLVLLLAEAVLSGICKMKERKEEINPHGLSCVTPSSNKEILVQ